MDQFLGKSGIHITLNINITWKTQILSLSPDCFDGSLDRNSSLLGLVKLVDMCLLTQKVSIKQRNKGGHHICKQTH